MKFNKKTATITAFLIGAIILAMSALADTKMGSGYTSLKDAMKTTSAKLTQEVDNFSFDVVLSLKVDDKVVSESISKVKYDVKNKAKETQDKKIEKGELRECYWYNDEKQNIHKNFADGSYDVYEKRPSKKEDGQVGKDIFEDEQAKDMERVIDAFVGNLQDTIQVDEANGSKMYIGDISEDQIPSTINALSSFIFKYSIMSDWNVKKLDIPAPNSNIHLLGAQGKAIENENGILESGIFTASIAAEDASGKEHIYSLEISLDIKDINNTIVKAPDLEGKKVTYSKEGSGFDKKYIGKYKNDIVKEEGSSFNKIGERFIEITAIEKGKITGRYYEVYRNGYETEGIKSFDFTTKDEDDRYFTIMEYTNEKGEKKQGVIHQSNRQNIDVSLNVEIDENNGGYSYSSDMEDFDSYFIRVFE